MEPGTLSARVRFNLIRAASLLVWAGALQFPIVVRTPFSNAQAGTSLLQESLYNQNKRGETR